MKILFHWSNKIPISNADKSTNQEEMARSLEHFSQCESSKDKEMHVYYDYSDALDNSIAGNISCDSNKVATFACGFKGENLSLEEVSK